jgi:hypothetical protein
MIAVSTSKAQSNVHAYLRWTALLFAAGFGMHAIDHVRRGMSAATTFVMIGGATEALSIAFAVAVVLTRRAWAPQVAIIVGFGSAVASTYGHLLPTFLPGYQDSFVSLPHTGVTWYSWLSLAAAMGTGILFGFAGISAAQRRQPYRTPYPVIDSNV